MPRGTCRCLLVVSAILNGYVSVFAGAQQEYVLLVATVIIAYMISRLWPILD